MARTLEEALRKLATMAVQINITAGAHRYREEMTPHYLWEVVALRVPGECYPAFCQKDDLLEAVEGVIAEIEERLIAGRGFVEEHLELKALPTVTIDKLMKRGTPRT